MFDRDIFSFSRAFKKTEISQETFYKVRSVKVDKMLLAEYMESPGAVSNNNVSEITFPGYCKVKYVSPVGKKVKSKTW